VPGRTQ